LTQIYQHDEDKKRGDNTLSSQLGFKGTFLFSGCFFMTSAIAFYYYFITYNSLFLFWIYLLFVTPLVTFFCLWFYKVTKDPANASYTNSLRMNQLAAACMIAYFLLLLTL
jgi:4-hydroxybenzoate polyprenyltransferase